MDYANHAFLSMRAAVLLLDSALKVRDPSNCDRHEPPLDHVAGIHLNFAYGSLDFRYPLGRVRGLNDLDLARVDYLGEIVRGEIMGVLAGIADGQFVKLAGFECEFRGKEPC